MSIQFLSYYKKIMDHFLNKSVRKFKYLILKAPPFLISLCYFCILSLLGFLALTFSKPKNTSFSKPNSLDMFFTSVSAATVSSMGTVEMEVFSNTQLIIMTFLMFFGGEIFTSMLHLQLKMFKLIKNQENAFQNSEKFNLFSSNSKSIEIIEFGMFSNTHQQSENHEIKQKYSNEAFRFKCFKMLIILVLCYLFVVHIIGSSLISMYMTFVPSAGEVLKKKGLNLPTFSVFTTVSTFVNCGFIPTSENMVVFKKNPGLLLILIPQILLGNTLYPVFLFLVIWFFKKTTRREEFSYMLENPGEFEYGHLFPGHKMILLAGTVLGFILVQFVMFCSLEWDSEATQGLSNYEKLIGSLFQVVNSRHTGESVFDLSLVTPAILVVFTVMMYFPAYTLFSPRIDEDLQIVKDCDKAKEEEKKSRRNSSLIECILFSQLSYLVIFIVLICITEREKMKEDPLNFNVLNIVFEVISAYGNVGFSMGYSCARQIKPDGHCKDALYGFVGRWSNKGKIILIIVMFFGRLKTFNMNGGKAWKLS